jgi:hypothetical protein
MYFIFGVLSVNMRQMFLLIRTTLCLLVLASVIK